MRARLGVPRCAGATKHSRATQSIGPRLAAQTGPARTDGLQGQAGAADGEPVVVSSLAHTSAHVRPIDGSAPALARVRSLGRLPTGQADPGVLDSVALSERAQALADVEGDEGSKRRSDLENSSNGARARANGSARGLDEPPRDSTEATPTKRSDEPRESADSWRVRDGSGLSPSARSPEAASEATSKSRERDDGRDADDASARDDQDVRERESESAVATLSEDEEEPTDLFGRPLEDPSRDPFGLERRQRERLDAYAERSDDPFGQRKRERESREDAFGIRSREGNELGRTVGASPLSNPSSVGETSGPFDRGRADKDVDAFGRKLDPFASAGQQRVDTYGRPIDPFGWQSADRQVDAYGRKIDPFARESSVAETSPFRSARSDVETSGRSVGTTERASASDNRSSEAAAASSASAGLTFGSAPERVGLHATGRSSTNYAVDGSANVDYRRTDRSASPFETDRSLPGPFGAAGNVSRRIQQFLQPATTEATGGLVDGAA